ncbi:LORF11 [Gallid alphaherpesvirus 2]|uniref:Uncharacterized gene 72 protein n=2 Tax=Gallid alphaherpesvirus 2 TaxID=10390 RepID=VG72_GAHVM|nr:protein LORF5 [Gallid alphaherpesvirus 2]Q9E6M1.1 RecName: Full=Uncharacterized gene 72 protein [Marek's disease herpesvirus type 1 strain MD5]QOJ42196.1 protein LORF5 [synthetic construct]AAG14252.1 hypothetical protein [Gallid alphaherpesvirus 2]AAS01702.1 hypothetical protein [Gallid alphaherpesvirus 2]ABR13150.1 LORF11 [Gallid alphaherpesvirus 2]AFM74641.1 LORF11 [Gallid alphaherpesvirus 2]
MSCFASSIRRKKVDCNRHPNQDNDPERTVFSSGAVLFLDQLKRLPSNPRYVMSIGSVPAERSTIALFAHFDDVPDPHTLICSMYEWMQVSGPIQNLNPPKPSAEWFPEFQCTSTRSTIIQALYNINCGPPWSLLGRIRTEVTVLRCVQVTDAAGMPGLIRFERRTHFGRNLEAVTVTPLPESTNPSTDLAYLRSLYKSKLYTIILLEWDHKTFHGNDYDELRNSIAWLNIRLGSTRWSHVVNFVRNTTDADFALYGDYLTTFWELDVDTNTCTQMGMGAVYAGAFENIDVMLAEMLMYDSAATVDKPHSSNTRTSEISKIDFLIEDPPPPKHSDILQPVEDKYGWIRASENLEPRDPNTYITSVSPECMLYPSKDIAPCYRYTRDTVSRLYHKMELDGSAATHNNQGNYFPNGCDCDADESYVKELSEVYLDDLKWVVEECCRRANDMLISEKLKPWKETLNLHISGDSTTITSKVRQRKKVPPIMYFTGTWDDWLHRSHSTYTAEHNIQYRSSRRIRLDLFTERPVARSTMPPLHVSRCGAVALIKPFLRRLCNPPANRDCERVLLSMKQKLEDLDIDNTEVYPPQDLCFKVFIGTSITPIVRKFFSADWSRAGKCGRSNFRKELESTVRRISVPLEKSKPELAFIFSLSVVTSNVENGARTCTETLFSFGGAAIDMTTLIDGINKLLVLCDLLAVSGIRRLSTIESIPDIGTSPYRCILQRTTHITACMTPKVVRCENYNVLQSHWEECIVRSSEYLTYIPSQIEFVTHLTTRCPLKPENNDWYLGLFFPFKGFRVITAETKRWLAEYTRRFHKWFQWGEGSPHYAALRHLIPLCDCYLTDACMTNNFFGCGILFHMHCVPTPERESRIVAILTRALTEAQKYAESSLHVDIDTQNISIYN